MSKREKLKSEKDQKIKNLILKSTEYKDCLKKNYCEKIIFFGVMKKRLFFAVLTTFTTVAGQLEQTAANDQAKDKLTRANGMASRFIYDELKQISLGARSNGLQAKPEITQTRLNNRLVDIELRMEKVLDRCGPGAERRSRKNGTDSPINLEGRAGGWGSHDLGGGLGLPLESGRISALDRPEIAGQPNGLGTIGFEGSMNFGPSGFDPLEGLFDRNPFFSQSSGLHGIGGHGGFDPLGALLHHTATRRRRRRYADGERVTKAKIQKKIKRLQASFEPMESFLETELENCSSERVASLRHKVTKVKDRVEKVLKRQGETILKRQRRLRRN